MSSPLEQLMVGRVLGGRYEIGEILGRGGMSVVYRALDRTLGRPVAVKLISLPGESAELRTQLRERFRREAGAAASIPAHPNVVQIYDYGTDAELDVDFIVMEILSGRDLKAALAEAPPRMGEAIRILREAARGVAAGHRAGIVHRDVKPANIFLTGQDALETVRILDFGIAKPLVGGPEDDLTQGGQLPHSPAYASPEQLERGRPLTAASDVYQLGLIGYELLTGERPYDAPARDRIRGGESVPPADGAAWESLPDPLREVILQALCTDPAERFADAATFAEALAAAAAAEDDRTLLAADRTRDLGAMAGAAAGGMHSRPPGQTELHQPPPPTDRPRSVPAVGSGRKGGRSALIAAGAAVAILGGAWLLTRGGDDPPTTTLAGSAAADNASVGEEFEVLQADAAEEQIRQRQQAAATEVEPSEAPENLPQLQAAAAEVQRAVVELNDSWVNADLDRHLEFYADRLAFYSRADAPRSLVRTERERDLARYDRDRSITINRQSVNFPGNDPDRARVLVDKEWEFLGSEWRRTGAGRQELLLERQAGRWRVTSERMVEVYRSNVSRV